MGAEGPVSSQVGIPASKHWNGVQGTHRDRAQLGSEVQGPSNGESEPVWEPMKQLGEVAATSARHERSP